MVRHHAERMLRPGSTPTWIPTNDSPLQSPNGCLDIETTSSSRIAVTPDMLSNQSLIHTHQALLLPALLAAALYALISYVLLPLYRRHRTRYSQYLPVHTGLHSLTSTTQSLRSRVTDAFLQFILPSRWSEARHRRQQSSRVVDARDDEDEEMNGGFGFEDSDIEDEGGDRGRRDGLSLSMDARARARDESREDISDRRLSRELEEGFADDSEEESEFEEAAPARHY
jgi:hypothetical protein